MRLFVRHALVALALMAAPARGQWQSAPLDALPALTYQIVARVVVAEDSQAPAARLLIVAANDGRTLAEALVPDGPAGSLPRGSGEREAVVAFESKPPGAVRSRLFGPSPRASR